MEEYGLGCLPEKKDVRDYKLRRKVAMAAVYPEEYEAKRGPLVKNQGSVGSCVAHATSEILESFHPTVRMSTNFLYGIHKLLYATPGPGMYLRDACKIVLTYGDPEYDICPGNNEVTKVYEIAEEKFYQPGTLENAAKYKIDSFIKLRTDDDIKYGLMNYGPALIAVEWYDGNRLNKEFVMQKGTKASGGHAMMLYGWNQKGWLVQNSWGKTWGNGGCFILPYDYKIREAYAFVPKEKIDTDVVIPERNIFVELFYKVLNNIVNFIIDLFTKK